MRPAQLVPLLLVVAAACSVVRRERDELRGPDTPPPTVSPVEAARLHITPRDVERYVAFLASDDRHGRGTPSPGLSRAAAWLSAMFQTAGLEPRGDAGGFLQYWPHPHADSAGEPVRVPNVVGMLPARDLTRADEYVIVLAHYDHLGVGAPNEAGDSVYNGADDNASGVAAMVEVVQAFAGIPEGSPRPVVFLATSGSEQGRLGASWFARHPTVRLENAVAVINLDMVGRGARETIGVVGFGRSSLGPFLAAVAEDHRELGLRIEPEPAAGEPFGDGDHAPLAALGIPAVVITAGVHPDHGTPEDEMDGVDVDKIARVAKLVFLATQRLAAGEFRPAPDPADLTGSP